MINTPKKDIQKADFRLAGYFESELLKKSDSEKKELFFGSLDKDERVVIDEILKGRFTHENSGFIEFLNQRGIQPLSKIMQIYNKRKTMSPEAFYEEFNSLNKDIKPGEKTVGIVDIRGSSNMDIPALSEKMMKMQFLTNLFEDKFLKEGFSVITPSAGDDFIFSILGENDAYQDLAIIRIFYVLMKKLGVEVNFFLDKSYIGPEQFLVLENKNSIHSANIGGVTEISNTYLRFRKIGGVSKFIGHAFLRSVLSESKSEDKLEKAREMRKNEVNALLRGDAVSTGEILNDKRFDSIMLNELKDAQPYQDGDSDVFRLLESSTLGKVIARIIDINELDMDDVIEYKIADENIEIIRGGYRNDSLFLIEGETMMSPLIGKEKRLRGLHVVGEASLLQGHRSIANADCDVQKGSKYIKISHDFLNAILEGKSLKIGVKDPIKLQMDPSDKMYMEKLFKDLNARRLAENLKKAA